MLVHHTHTNANCFQLKDLEGLGYRAVAFAFFEDDIHVAYTKECVCCMKNSVVDYIRSVIIAGIVYLLFYKRVIKKVKLLF